MHDIPQEDVLIHKIYNHIHAHTLWRELKNNNNNNNIAVTEPLWSKVRSNLTGLDQYNLKSDFLGLKNKK